MQVQCILMQNLFAVVFPSHICAFCFFDKDQNPHPPSAKAFLRKMTSFSNYQVFPFKLFGAKAKNGPNAHKNGFMETPLVTSRNSRSTSSACRSAISTVSVIF